MLPTYLQLHSVHRRPGYSEAARVGDLLFICGQVALDANGALVGRGDPAAQTEQVYANLRRILEELGGGLEHLVKTTSLITDRAHLAAYQEVRGRILATPRVPNTLAIVSGLAHPDYLVEIEAVAAVP